jgi:integrase
MEVRGEGPIKITKATVDAAWRRRTRGVRTMVRDAECRGLALVVNPTGMAWRYDYRPRGLDPRTNKRWPNASVTIGNPTTHSPDDARAEANRFKGRARAGGDPAAERRANAEVSRRARALTLDRLLEEYASAMPRRAKLRGAGLPSPKHVGDEVANARAAVAAMNATGRAAASLTAADVREMVARDASRPATARARFGALSRFLDWCQDAGHLEANPCNLVSRARRPRAAQARTHYLKLGDLGILWSAAGVLPHPVWRDVARFLVAVPCRRGEAASLRWSHLDLVAGEWNQPAQLTKNGDPHRIYMHPLALDLLRERRAARGGPETGLVFPAPRSGGPLETFGAIKRALDAVSGLVGWRWHDFRRSFATTLGEAGVAEPVVDAVLNHRQSATRGGVLGVYQRASRWPEHVRAMQAWGQVLSGAFALEGAVDARGLLVTLSDGS